MKDAPESPRVVYDTNVLISALGFKGRTARLWTLVEEERVALILSPFILDELERNLAKKLRLAMPAVRAILDEVKGRAEIIEPTLRLDTIKEKDSDNRILECAISGKATVIVTGNMKHIRPLGRFRGIEIKTPGEFFDDLGEK
jgi:putative PIN family toxin of toxin-antitoxin system